MDHFINLKEGVVLSFYIKETKPRILQDCSLKHTIKTGMISVLGKMNLFRLCLL